MSAEFAPGDIVCPVDLSPLSSRALAHAVALAAAYDARLHVVHVFTAPLPLRAAFPQYAGSMLDGAARTDLIAQLDALVKTARAQGLTVRTTVQEGDVVDEIVALARAVGAPVVMATDGRSGVGRMVLGSITERTLRVAPCPILTVPPAVDLEAGVSLPRFGHILCPVDFSDESVAALGFARSLAARSGGRLTALHVIDWFPGAAWGLRGHVNVDEVRRAREADAAARLQTLLPAQGRDATEAIVVVADKPYREILRRVEAGEIDVIVIGVRGRGTADRLLLGSTTDLVIREATCPVLTVPMERAAGQP